MVIAYLIRVFSYYASFWNTTLRMAGHQSVRQPSNFYDVNLFEKLATMAIKNNDPILWQEYIYYGIFWIN